MYRLKHGGRGGGGVGQVEMEGGQVEIMIEV